MTFSIAAGDSRRLGVAVASKFLAVGAAVPAARVGVGAVATQALANLSYRAGGLAVLQQGASPQEAVAALTGADAEAQHRQLGIVDAQGRAATYTGTACMDWAGGVSGTAPSGEAYAIQGNILTGPGVVAAMEQAFLGADARLPLAQRLFAVLAAGDAAGGDRRGRQSAALLVVGAGAGYGGDDVEIDLRVDDHADPVAELARLMGIHALLFGKPTQTVPLEGASAQRLRAALDALGYANPDLEAALFEAAGVENLEERLVAGRLDPVVLAYLEERAAQRP